MLSTFFTRESLASAVSSSQRTIAKRCVLTLTLGIALGSLFGCASTNNGATSSAGAGSELNVLDGFVVGQTPLTSYLQKKRGVCSVQRFRNFYELDGRACYPEAKQTGLKRVYFYHDGTGVVLYYDRSVLNSMVSQFTQRYGQAQQQQTASYRWQPTAQQVVGIDTEGRAMDLVSNAFTVTYRVLPGAATQTASTDHAPDAEGGAVATPISTPVATPISTHSTRASRTTQASRAEEGEVTTFSESKRTLSPRALSSATAAAEAAANDPMPDDAQDNLSDSLADEPAPRHQAAIPTTRGHSSAMKSQLVDSHAKSAKSLHGTTKSVKGAKVSAASSKASHLVSSTKTKAGRTVQSTKAVKGKVTQKANQKVQSGKAAATAKSRAAASKVTTKASKAPVTSKAAKSSKAVKSTAKPTTKATAKAKATTPAKATKNTKAHQQNKR